MRIRNFSLALILFVILFDWLTKILVRRQMPYKFAVVENPGLVFGLPTPGFFNLAVVLVVLLGFVLVYLWKFPHARSQTGFALIVGGAVANILDRLVGGTVTDFLNFGVSTVNFADLAIFSGIVALLFGL